MQIDRAGASRGFSLLEVLVANTILAIGLVSLAQVLALAIAANASAGKATYAALLASQKIEDLHAAPWASVAATDGDSVDRLDRAGGMRESTLGTAEFTRRWSVAPLPTDPSESLVFQVVVGTGRQEARIVSVRTRTMP